MRIADALRAVASHETPYYHPKMREGDVHEIKQYEAQLHQRIRERTVRASSIVDDYSGILPFFGVYL